MEFCEKVRKETNVYFEASFEHPFVRGIADGTLPLEKFKFYMLQDSYYLKHYTKVLALAAAKATNEEDIHYFLDTARFIHEAELELHRTTFKDLGVTAEEIEQFEAAPAAYNYVSHMYQAVHTGDVAEAFAAILPCPWLYQEIGQKIKQASPNIPLYAQWIALYGSDKMKETIEKQKKMMNRLAAEQQEKEKWLYEHFKKSCYYEWQFWEMAWTMQNWMQEVYIVEPAKINTQKPLVHCITNYVVANFTANGLLAIGASPVMADAQEEVAEMASKADALLLNIGTLNERTISSMQVAGQSANTHHVPIVLDPVGAGATVFRTRTTLALLQQLKVSLIRCNIGELAAIAGVNWHSKGVDSGSGKLDVVQTAKTVARNYNCLVIVTGETDVLTDGVQVALITGGHEKITKVTGSGCLLSAICTALLASSTEPFSDLANLLREYKQISEWAYGPIGTLHENVLNHLERLAEGTK